MYHVCRIKCKALTPLIGRGKCQIIIIYMIYIINNKKNDLDEESLEENSQSMRSWSNVALIDRKYHGEKYLFIISY